MTITRTVYNTEELLGVIVELDPIRSFWRRWFPGSIQSDRERIEWAKIYGNRRLAPLVLPTVPGRSGVHGAGRPVQRSAGVPEAQRYGGRRRNGGEACWSWGVGTASALDAATAVRRDNRGHSSGASGYHRAQGGVDGGASVVERVDYSGESGVPERHGEFPEERESDSSACGGQFVEQRGGADC